MILYLLGHLSCECDIVLLLKYCQFVNFGDNFIFGNSIERHICRVENFCLGHDLSTSVNDRVILPFHEGFISVKLCICEV